MNKVLQVILLGLLGAFTGYLLVSYFFSVADSGFSFFYGFTIILWLPIIFFLSVTLHELGHIIFGSLQGFSFRSLSVGPLRLYRDNQRIKIGRSTGTKGLLGFAICLPHHYDNIEDLKKKFAWYAFGGPAVSLLTAALALYVSLELTGSSIELILLKSIFWSFTAINFITFLLTIIPTGGGGYYTDGARIYNILIGNIEGKLDVALLSVMTNSIGGKSPDQLDKNILHEALALPGDLPFKAYCHHYLYLINLYEKNVTAAADHLDTYFARRNELPQLAQPTPYIEKAFFMALFENKGKEAKAIYQHAGSSGVITRDMYLRAEAAIALALGNPIEAQKHATQAMAELPNNLDQGAAIAYRKWLELILEKSAETSVLD